MDPKATCQWIIDNAKSVMTAIERGAYAERKDDIEYDVDQLKTWVQDLSEWAGKIR